MTSIQFCNLGRIGYQEALDLQDKLVWLRQQDKIPDTVLLLEHPPVLTLGVRGQYSNIYLDEKALAEQGVEIFEINRGGDVTYHGPGQLVAYPIVKILTFDGGIRRFVAALEDAVMDMLSRFYGICSEAKSGKMTGVWVNDAKIAAFGIAVRHGVSMHGLAYNINTNLKHFDWINPCGLSKGVTSLEREVGRTIDFELATEQLRSCLAKSLDRSADEISKDHLFEMVEGDQI